MIKFSSVDIKKSKVETLVVPVCEDKNIHADRAVAALAKKALAVKEFRNEPLPTTRDERLAGKIMCHPQRSISHAYLTP